MSDNYDTVLNLSIVSHLKLINSKLFEITVLYISQLLLSDEASRAMNNCGT